MLVDRLQIQESMLNINMIADDLLLTPAQSLPHVGMSATVSCWHSPIRSRSFADCERLRLDVEHALGFQVGSAKHSISWRAAQSDSTMPRSCSLCLASAGRARA